MGELNKSQNFTGISSINACLLQNDSTCIKFYNIISVEEYFGLQIECICTSCIIIQRILLILKLLNVIAKKLINHAPVAGKVRSAN